MDSRDPLHLQPDAPRKGTAGNDADLSQNGDAHDQECETNAHDQKRGEGCRRTHARTPVSCRLLNVVGMATPSDECSVPTLGKLARRSMGQAFLIRPKSSPDLLATMAADRLVMAALECAFEGQVAVPRTARCHLISRGVPDPH